MKPVAILCRSCGGPCDKEIGTHMRCHFCGSETAIDSGTRQRLVTHLARMQRAADKARCALRERILAHVMPAMMVRMKAYLYGSLAILVVVVPLLLGLGMLPFALIEPASRGEEAIVLLVAVVVLGFAMLVAVGIFPLGLYLAFREGKNADLAAARGAREVLSSAEATASTRCTRCGGHAELVVIGQQAAVPCPWCGSSLVVECVDAAKAAADAIVVALQNTSDAALRRVRIKAGLPPNSRVRYRIPGFVLHGGVYVGALHDVQLWLAFDTQELGLHARIEADRGTRLPGTIWFVRSEALELHTQLLGTYGLHWPPAVPAGADLERSFVVFADSGVDAASVARSPCTRQLLMSLSESDSVRFDPAGGSEWSITPGPFGVGAARCAAQAELLARAVLELA
jgi:Zn finger protein HypA/HybF involved in hydrogenase expression